MSRFLKLIVHLVILLTIIDILALALPPFFGITTAIIDSTDQVGNLPIGSVTYAESVSVEDLQAGDSILVQDGNSSYKYTINSIDASSGIYNVYDQTDVEAGEEAVTLRNTAQKVIITIGLIGYLIIAVQSTEGLIIVGLVIMLLVILFILSELWRKDKSSEDEEEDEEEMDVPAEADPDNTEGKSKRQLKKEAKLRAKEERKAEKLREKQEIEEATDQLRAERKARKKEEKLKKKEARKLARTGGFIEDYEPIETKAVETEADPTAVEEAIGQGEGVPEIQHEDVVTDAANEELRKEIAAATAVENTAVENTAVDETTEVVIPKEEISLPTDADLAEQIPDLIQEIIQKKEVADVTPEDIVEEEPVVFKKMAVPIYTEQQLLEKAHQEGDAPEVIKDEKIGVTLLDYSSIIGGNPSDEEEE